MAVNRRPKEKFSQISNDLIKTVPTNMTGVILLFLSKPPGWKMRLEDLFKNWTESERSLKRCLKKLRETGHITIKPYYDKKKKRFAGSYYALIETSEEDVPKSKLNAPARNPDSNEQRPTKSRASAKAESLQNDGVNNKNVISYNNTNSKYIDSNTIEPDCDSEELEKADEDFKGISYGSEEYHRLLREGLGKVDYRNNDF